MWLRPLYHLYAAKDAGIQQIRPKMIKTVDNVGIVWFSCISNMAYVSGVTFWGFFHLHLFDSYIFKLLQANVLYEILILNVLMKLLQKTVYNYS